MSKKCDVIVLAKANKHAAGEWKRAHQPKRLLAWVARYHSWRRG